MRGKVELSFLFCKGNYGLQGFALVFYRQFKQGLFPSSLSSYHFFMATEGFLEQLSKTAELHALFPLFASPGGCVLA